MPCPYFYTVYNRPKPVRRVRRMNEFPLYCAKICLIVVLVFIIILLVRR